jgi:hypothetical protein
LLVAIGFVVVVTGILLLVAFLTQEKLDPADLYPEPKPESDPFEQLAVLITPQELGVKAKAKKKSPDPYIPAASYTSRQANRILRTAKSLGDDDKQCFDQFITTYQDTLFEHCLANELAEDTEGGCEQMAYQYSIHTAVIEAALKNCIEYKPVQ